MDVISGSNYLPGDPRLVDHIVYELKAQGIFDNFRKECIADVDTKPAYQNLRQRVEGSVVGFLKTQKWNPDMNKNHLREMLRKNISESGFLETGVERIVDQVVNPKINSIFLPQVENVVYKVLGIEKPSTSDAGMIIKKEAVTSQEDKMDTLDVGLLPDDLEAVSPESEHGRKLESSNSQKLDENKIDDDESPPFEPLEEATSFLTQEDNSIDSHLSGFSGLVSHDSSHSFNTSTKIVSMEISSQDTQNSKQSSDDQSVVMSEETEMKMDISDDSNATKIELNAESSAAEANEKLQKETKNPDEPKKSDEAKKSDDCRVDDAKNGDDLKKNDESKKSDEVKKGDESKKGEKDKHRSSDRHKSRHDVKSKTEKDKRSDKKEHREKHHSSSRDKEKKEERNKEEKSDRDRKHDKEKSKNTLSRHNSSGSSSKEKSSKKDSAEKNKGKDSQNKETNVKESEKSKELENKDKIKEKKDSDHKDSKSSKDSSKEKRDSSKSRNDSKSKSHHSKSRGDSKSHSKHNGKSSSEGDKDKKDEKSHKKDDKHHSSDKSDKNEKHKKDSKSVKKSKDDHYSLKKNPNRRSTDRDSSDGHSGNRSSSSSLTESSQSSQQQNTQESSTVNSRSSGDSGNSDKTDKDTPTDQKIELVQIPPIKLIKPKFASNIFEARRLMKIRKKLGKIEKQSQINLLNSGVAANPAPEANHIENVAGARDKIEGNAIRKPNILKKATKNVHNSNLKAVNKNNTVVKEDKSVTDELSNQVPSPFNSVSKESWDAIEAKLLQNMMMKDGLCEETVYNLNPSTSETNGEQVKNASENDLTPNELPNKPPKNDSVDTLHNTENADSLIETKTDENIVEMDQSKFEEVPTKLDLTDADSTEATSTEETACLHLPLGISAQIQEHADFVHALILHLETITKQVKPKGNNSRNQKPTKKLPKVAIVDVNNTDGEISITPTRGTKRYCSPADMHNNNKSVRLAEEEKLNDLSASSKPTPIRTNSSRAKRAKDIDNMVNHVEDTFNLPLSPAESDKSFCSSDKSNDKESKKNSNIAKGPHSTSNKRYTTDDLYKPRLQFNSRRRSSRINN